MKKSVGIILTVIGIVTTAISLISQISVSVISGTDGPTAIYCKKIGVIPDVIIGMTAGIILLAVGIFMITRKKKGKQ